MEQFRAPDGTPLAYDVYEPTTDNRQPITIVWICGWSDHRSRWKKPAECLAAAGYAVYVLDQRGHGDSGGIRGHLSRFSQLLADLQAFRRHVRSIADRFPAPEGPRPLTPSPEGPHPLSPSPSGGGGTIPQILLGHSFGALVVLRYLETQPADPVAAAVLSSPWLGLARPVPFIKRLAARPLADLWPSLPLTTGLDARHLSRDPAVAPAYLANPRVHHVLTPGAWREIQWAQRVVPTDAHRIDVPLLFLLAGKDRIVDAERARGFAEGLQGRVETRWYPETYHEVLLDTDGDKATADTLEFLAGLV